MLIVCQIYVSFLILIMPKYGEYYYPHCTEEKIKQKCHLSVTESSSHMLKIKLCLQPPFTNKWVKSLSSVRLFATPWTVAYQPPPSMGFSRQEYWSGLLFPSPGDLPDPGIDPGSPAFQADTLTSEPPGKLLIANT